MDSVKSSGSTVAAVYRICLSRKVTGSTNQSLRNESKDAREFGSVGGRVFRLNGIKDGSGNGIFGDEITVRERYFTSHTTLDGLAASPGILDTTR